jgi:prepilin-type N-terminal cleavage/methylation domain-containing protein
MNSKYLIKQKGYSLVEMLVVIAIIALLVSFTVVALNNVRKKARDTKRKADINQIGRLLAAADCYLPAAGPGDYDLVDVSADYIASHQEYAQYAPSLPKDPKSGSAAASNYRYQVTSDNHCVIYTNLESENEPITLPGLTAPAPNAGTGAFQAAADGPNGTKIYYQISK